MATLSPLLLLRAFRISEPDHVRGIALLELRYRGDLGVAIQHVGVLVGRNAHRHLWPILLESADGLPPG